MGEYQVNKGVGREVEFKGLTAQYLFIFAGGLLGVFILFVVMYMAGVNQSFCIAFGLALATGIVWGTFHLNTQFGPHGLMKRMASHQYPRRIIHRRSIRRLLTQNQYERNA